MRGAASKFSILYNGLRASAAREVQGRIARRRRWQRGSPGSSGAPPTTLCGERSAHQIVANYPIYLGYPSPGLANQTNTSTPMSIRHPQWSQTEDNSSGLWTHRFNT